jgi:N-acetylneuraminic acid mutarotase
VGSAIYVLSGEIGGEIPALTESVLKFDDAQGVWSRVAPMPGARSPCVACVVGIDIYMFGGMDILGEDLASVSKYNTEANAWSVLEPMPDVENGHRVSVINGLIYIIVARVNSRGFLRFEPVTGA